MKVLNKQSHDTVLVESERIMSDNNNISDIVDIECDSFPNLKRNNYFYGKLLTANDFRMEQQYFVNKQRLANRLIHGNGVVCGLQITQKNTTQITITPGVAIDFCGREIIVPEAYDFDLQQNLPSDASSKVGVYIKYDFCGLDPATKVLKSSNCKDNCCYSTIKERFKIEAIVPKTTEASAEDICTQWNDYQKDPNKDRFCIKPCQVTNQNSVLLGEVAFTKDPIGKITVNQVINNRTIVFSNSTLYSLLECLKNILQKDVPKIEQINWENNATFSVVEKWLERIFHEDGFAITFDRLMNESTINENTVFLTLECYNADTSIQFFEKKEIVIKPKLTTLDTKKTKLQIILDKPTKGKENTYFSAEGIRKNFFMLRLLIRIKGDFVRDTTGKYLDGNFLGDKVPKGDGWEGGLFESWIIYKPITTSINFQLTPLRVVAKDQPVTVTSASITPNPPTANDVFHSIQLTSIDPAGNVKDIDSYNSDDKGNIKIPSFNLEVVGTHKIVLNYPGEIFKNANIEYLGSASTKSLVVSEPKSTSFIVKAPTLLKENQLLQMQLGTSLTFSAAIKPKPPQAMRGVLTANVFQGVELLIKGLRGSNFILKGKYNTDIEGNIIAIVSEKETNTVTYTPSSIGEYIIQLYFPGQTFDNTGDIFADSRFQWRLKVISRI